MSSHKHVDRAATPSHEQIERLALKFWQERGSPIGTPDADWFRAEEELRRQPSGFEDSLTAVAKEVGSAVGAVTAAVEKTLLEASEVTESVVKSVKAKREKR